MHLFLSRLRRDWLKFREDIDAVYTWVDGSDPRFLKCLAQYRDKESHAQDPFVAGARRFRDNDELRFSLRSLETYAPWINKVFLVTNGQVPSWLKPDHPRLRLVHHEEIFTDQADLPTFNSAAIETHLHRIPGLSHRFLYFNDDMFLGRPLQRTDFIFDSGKPLIRTEPWMLPDPQVAYENLVHRFLAYNHQLLKDSLDNHNYASIPHTPMVYDRREIEKVQAIWRKEFKHTSSMRFRRDETVLLQVLYAHHQALTRSCEVSVVGPEDHLFIMFEPPIETVMAQLEEVRRIKPKFFTINDDWDERGESEETVLRHFLNGYFPQPSSFEKA